MIREQKFFVVFDKTRSLNFNDINQSGQRLARYINNNIRHKKDLKIRSLDNIDFLITRETAYKIASRDKVKSINGKLNKMSDNLYSVKLRAGLYIDQLLKYSIGNNKVFKDTKNHHFAKDGFIYRKAYYLDVDKKYYSITISIGIKDGVNTVYNLGKIKEAEFPQLTQGRDR